MNGNPETKNDRFKRLAAARTNAVIKKLQVLGNCANQQAYEYTQEEVDKIFSAIEKYIKVVKSRFKLARKEEFKL